MGVNCPGEVFGAAAVFHVGDDFADQFTGVVAEDLGAENLVGLRVGDDFRIAVRDTRGDGPAVRGKVELADVDCAILRLGGVFAESDRGNLGAGVNDGRHEIPVHMPVLPGNPFRHGDAILFGFVGEHRAGDGVTDRPDAGDVGTQVGVDLDALLVVELDA